VELSTSAGFFVSRSLCMNVLGCDKRLLCVVVMLLREFLDWNLQKF
jgi:hypothetical protein